MKNIFSKIFVSILLFLQSISVFCKTLKEEDYLKFKSEQYENWINFGINNKIEQKKDLLFYLKYYLNNSLKGDPLMRDYYLSNMWQKFNLLKEDFFDEDDLKNLGNFFDNLDYTLFKKNKYAEWEKAGKNKDAQESELLSDLDYFCYFENNYKDELIWKTYNLLVDDFIGGAKVKTIEEIRSLYDTSDYSKFKIKKYVELENWARNSNNKKAEQKYLLLFQLKSLLLEYKFYISNCRSCINRDARGYCTEDEEDWCDEEEEICYQDCYDRINYIVNKIWNTYNLLIDDFFGFGKYDVKNIEQIKTAIDQIEYLEFRDKKHTEWERASTNGTTRYNEILTKLSSLLKEIKGDESNFEDLWKHHTLLVDDFGGTRFDNVEALRERLLDYENFKFKAENNPVINTIINSELTLHSALNGTLIAAMNEKSPIFLENYKDIDSLYAYNYLRELYDPSYKKVDLLTKSEPSNFNFQIPPIQFNRIKETLDNDYKFVLDSDNKLLGVEITKNGFCKADTVSLGYLHIHLSNPETKICEPTKKLSFIKDFSVLSAVLPKLLIVRNEPISFDLENFIVNFHNNIVNYLISKNIKSDYKPVKTVKEILYVGLNDVNNDVNWENNIANFHEKNVKDGKFYKKALVNEIKEEFGITQNIKTFDLDALALTDKRGIFLGNIRNLDLLRFCISHEMGHIKTNVPLFPYPWNLSDENLKERKEKNIDLINKIRHFIDLSKKYLITDDSQIGKLINKISNKYVFRNNNSDDQYYQLISSN